MSNFTVDLEFTPNPNTLKYTANANFFAVGAYNFKTKESALGKSLIAEKLFDLKGIESIMVGRNFVTVTLGDHDSLTDLNDQVISTIQKFLESGENAVDTDAMAKVVNEAHANLTDIEKHIVKILDEEIRPSVAMDGGDITFEKFEDGIVFLHMKGSCAGCPSSTATLKLGIENRLKDAIPEVLEVVAV